jgi:hypothetical protein
MVRVSKLIYQRSECALIFETFQNAGICSILFCSHKTCSTSEHSSGPFRGNIHQHIRLRLPLSPAKAQTCIPAPTPRHCAPSHIHVGVANHQRLLRRNPRLSHQPSATPADPASCSETIPAVNAEKNTATTPAPRRSPAPAHRLIGQHRHLPRRTIRHRANSARASNTPG